ncbi:hypothetical protein [Robertmurraya korlensis]|uniref:hypothetical protein n=1 Tax=Robertmurraya korlensis TaxID=519977 RepID=UPI0018DEA432|nr:hypothetical protein [Robertmurraya korlensis]
MLTIQYVLENKLQKAIPAIQEPHIQEAIEKILDANKHHTKVIDELFDIVDSKPNTTLDYVLGSVVGKFEELMGFQDIMGGAVGSWQQIHHLLILNQQAMGAFAVAEQLGLSLGIKEIVGVGYSITHEKTMHQLLLQEYMLEMAPISILYKEEV